VLENKQKSDFLIPFTDEIEESASKTGSYQVSFLNKMTQYMEGIIEPDILIPPYIDTNKRIAVNAYLFDEDQKSLELYVVLYSFEQNEVELQTVNMTTLLEVANQAKRFVTNAQSLVNTIDRSLQVHELAALVSKNIHSIEEVNIYVLTNLFYSSNKPIEISIPSIETVNVQVWDIDRIIQLMTMEQGTQSIHIDFEKDLGQSLEMMFVPDPKQDSVKDNFDCYVGFIPAVFLAKAYDQWGPKLVERNVRSFLQARGGTNKGIRDTLKDPIQRQMFVAYNNGISSVARSGDIEQIHENMNLYRIKGLTGWQIVNGGQTTASIHQAYTSGIDLSDVHVQAKLTILQVAAEQEKDQHLLEDEMVAKISEFANTQNKINKSDLLANTRFLSELENLSRNVWVPTLDGRKADAKWFFERARGQYMVDVSRRKSGKEQTDFKKQYPADKVISKVDLAKNYMSWEGYPHISSKGGEEAFSKFMDLNKEYWKHERDEQNDMVPLKLVTEQVYQQLVARNIINIHVTNIVESLKLRGYRANVIYYTASMFHYAYGDKIDLVEIWNKQAVSDKWDEVIQVIAEKTLYYLRDSAGERNVTQWAKQEACWLQYKESHAKELSHII
jgi:hypothetical protein